MNIYFSSLLGNEENKKMIGAAIEEQTLSHAYIIEGPQGSGKRSFAKLIAAASVCERRQAHNGPVPCMNCPHCKKILSGNSIDYHVLEAESDKASIAIDEVRTLRQDVALSSTEEETKFYVIVDAEKLGSRGQNALLKVIEEPPTDVLFFLLTTSASTLLQTIRSRAPIIRMGLLTKEQLRDYVESHELGDMPQLDSLIQNAGGNLGWLLSHLTKEESNIILEQRKQVEQFVESILQNKFYAPYLEEKKKLPKERNDLILFLGTVLQALRDLLLINKSEDVSLMFYLNQEQAEKLANTVNNERLALIIHQTEKAIENLQNMSNLSLTTTSLLISIFTSK